MAAKVDSENKDGQMPNTEEALTLIRECFSSISGDRYGTDDAMAVRRVV